MFILSLNFLIFYINSEEHKKFTIVNLYNNLFWSEKEISEMHGIDFLESGDSRNLLLDYSLGGNPMLKSYSISGYLELIYNFILSALIYMKVWLFEASKTENKFDY
jgi:NADH:ubiquinone oxidoreductase subunit C